MFKTTELVEVGFELRSRWLESNSSSHYNIYKCKEEIVMEHAGFKNKTDSKLLIREREE